MAGFQGTIPETQVQLISDLARSGYQEPLPQQQLTVLESIESTGYQEPLTSQQLTTINDIGSTGYQEPLPVQVQTVLGATNNIEILDILSRRGFENSTDSVLTWSDANRRLTLAPAVPGVPFRVRIANVWHSFAAAINWDVPDVTGLYVCHFASDGSPVVHANPDGSYMRNVLYTLAHCSDVYWNATNATAVLVGDERHTVAIDPRVHLMLHLTCGAMLSRMSPHGYAQITLGGVDDGSPEAEDAQLNITGCTLMDEDISNHSTSTPQQLAPLISRVWYLFGPSAAPEWRTFGASIYPFADAAKVGSGTRCFWNQLTGGSWQLTEITNNQYSYMIIAATNDIRDRYVAIVGQDDANSLANARLGAEAAIVNLVHGTLPFPEVKVIGVLIFQTSSTYDNVPKAGWRSLGTGYPFLDWRRNLD